MTEKTKGTGEIRFSSVNIKAVHTYLPQEMDLITSLNAMWLYARCTSGVMARKIKMHSSIKNHLALTPSSFRACIGETEYDEHTSFKALMHIWQHSLATTKTAKLRPDKHAAWLRVHGVRPTAFGTEFCSICSLPSLSSMLSTFATLHVGYVVVPQMG